MNTDSEEYNAIEGDREREKETPKGFMLYIYAQRIWMYVYIMSTSKLIYMCIYVEY
jgi:hypothetical protein